MAKQSGLHQIRGKVGEHSYYKQTGINAGLIRSINQGLSARVKDGDEFANTRLNNAEFGQACRMAGVLGKLITPKFRPMILPFSQSKMAKQILEAIKMKSGNWGERNLADTDEQIIIDVLNSVKKNDPADWGLSFSVVTDGTLDIDVNETLFDAKCSAIGAAGIKVALKAATPWFGKYVAADDKYAPSSSRSNDFQTGILVGDGSAQMEYTFRPEPPVNSDFYGMQFFVLTIMPYRPINSVEHILQEHCTFIAFEVPSAA